MIIKNAIFNFSFVGCIGKMMLNGREIYFDDESSAPSSGFSVANQSGQKTLFGMVTLGCVFDANCFADTKCKNGICSNNTCKCNPGWTGNI